MAQQTRAFLSIPFPNAVGTALCPIYVFLRVGICCWRLCPFSPTALGHQETRRHCWVKSKQQHAIEYRRPIRSMSISNLPAEIIHMILARLDVRDRAACAMAARLFALGAHDIRERYTRVSLEHAVALGLDSHIACCADLLAVRSLSHEKRACKVTPQMLWLAGAYGRLSTVRLLVESLPNERRYLVWHIAEGAAAHVDIIRYLDTIESSVIWRLAGRLALEASVKVFAFLHEGGLLRQCDYRHAIKAAEARGAHDVVQYAHAIFPFDHQPCACDDP